MLGGRYDSLQLFEGSYEGKLELFMKERVAFFFGGGAALLTFYIYIILLFNKFYVF